ncbi:MAG: hypothetical protein ABI920_16125 [Casimicrobiaceae bacterium]
MAGESHRWKFIRSGGVDQVVIRSGADIVNLEHLDQKLWVALACPTRGVHFDPRTLDLIDADDDGRIRAPELIAVSHWVRDHFADPDVLMGGGDSVPLAAINEATASGKTLAADARALLNLVGKPDASAIALADLEERLDRLAKVGLNGDGIVPEAAADDPDTAKLIALIIDTVGGIDDRTGKPGVDQEHVNTFFTQAETLDAWRATAKGSAEIEPLGADSRAAAEALAAVKAKIDDYFARCELAAYDASATAPLNPDVDDYRKLGGDVLTNETDAIARLPLATAGPRQPLPLRDNVNPAWAARIDTFRIKTAEPLLGSAPRGGALDSLTESDWRNLEARLAPCRKWLDARPDTKLDAIPPAELQALLADESKARIEALIARDAEAGPSNDRIDELERLMRFKRDLVHLLNNFVSFSEFYSREGAIFQAGTLYLDARSCDLAVAVNDIAQHAKLAGLSKVYLAYCECTRPGQKRTIAAAFTAGDVDYLLVGRNGIFYDREGKDWDATITKVIESPLSIRQAFFLPYKKFLRMIEEQVAKRAAASDQRAQGTLTRLATQASEAGPVRPSPAEAALRDRQRRIDVGTVAALGVALGSISAVLVGVFAKFVELGWWIPVALLGIILAISGPSMLIAWLKLRQRSLGPLLDAGGWAINGRMRINVPLGGALTQTAHVPPSAERRMRDPFRQSRAGRYAVVLLLVVAAIAITAWRMGLIGGVPMPGAG